MRIPGRPAWIAPIKPNLIALGGAIVSVVWICVAATIGIVRDTLPPLLASEVADEVRTAALHLLATVAGLNFAGLALAGLVSWGIKLLDETAPTPADEPTVPAATHERVVAALTRAARDDEAAVADIEAEAAAEAATQSRRKSP